MSADPKLLAEQCAEFVKGELGTYYLKVLSVQYNAFHQQAEDASLTAEQKAGLVDRAAGLKFAIDWLTSRQQMYDRGDFNKKEAKADE